MESSRSRPRLAGCLGCAALRSWSRCCAAREHVSTNASSVDGMLRQAKCKSKKLVFAAGSSGLCGHAAPSTPDERREELMQWQVPKSLAAAFDFQLSIALHCSSPPVQMDQSKCKSLQYSGGVQRSHNKRSESTSKERYSMYCTYSSVSREPRWEERRKGRFRGPTMRAATSKAQCILRRLPRRRQG